jgi:hypothetical protein
MASNYPIRHFFDLFKWFLNYFNEISAKSFLLDVNVRLSFTIFAIIEKIQRHDF